MKSTSRSQNRLRFWFRKNVLRLSIGLMITALFILDIKGILTLPLMDRVENIVYDSRVKMTTQSSVDERIIIIDIDEKSLQAEGHWPWSRHKLAKLMDKLFDEYGIALLAMDMVFAEKDDSEILHKLDKEIAKHHGEAVFNSLLELRQSLDSDHIFADSMKDRPVVLGYYFTHDASDSVTIGKLPPAVLKKGAFEEDHGEYYKTSGHGANITVLQDSAESAGFFENPNPDADGVFRRSPMLQEYNGELYESLSLAAAHTFLGRTPKLVIGQSGDGTGEDHYQSIEQIHLGKQVIPVDSAASVLIPFRGRQGSFRYISATDILNDNLADPYSLIGQIAFVGTTAPGLVDHRATPIQNIFPGVEIHANLLAGILDNSFKHRPAYVLGAEILVLLIIGLILSLTLPALSPIWSTLMVGTMLAGTIMINLHIWTEFNIVLSLAQPVLLIMGLFLFNMSYGFLTESRARHQMGKLFGQYVPPELVNEMAMDPTNFSVEGERREMTVLFSDIRGFTTISEKLDPTELSELLNEFLTPMTSIIHHGHGTIDKYMGDAIMAFWGAPLHDSNNAQHALEAALQMEFMTHELHKEFLERGWPEIHIGIGLNTGTMNVGNMGSEFRMAYTVLGDAVNLGARLESLTKQYGVHTIISEYTRDAVNGFVFRELDRVRVKGKNEPVAIFEPVCKKENVSHSMQRQLDEYSEALELYRQQHWETARQKFMQLHDEAPDFLLYKIYLERIDDFLINPPGEDWDGVFTHSTK